MRWTSAPCAYRFQWLLLGKHCAIGVQKHVVDARLNGARASHRETQSGRADHYKLYTRAEEEDDLTEAATRPHDCAPQLRGGKQPHILNAVGRLNSRTSKTWQNQTQNQTNKQTNRKRTVATTHAPASLSYDAEMVLLVRTRVDKTVTPRPNVVLSITPWTARSR